MSQRYFERIGFTGDSEELIFDISEAFDLGKIKSASVLEVGYEDCNVALETNKGKFVIKAFAKSRNLEQIQRYEMIMRAAVDNGVHHPALCFADSEALFKHSSGISLVVMDFIEGKTYFDTKTAPSDEDLDLIMSEAVKINELELNPEPLFDSWAIPHIHKMYELTREYLGEEGKGLVDQAIARYDSIQLEKLTNCFVHGDIISTNTLKDANGKIWILDFAVSNTYPKIQEIAVIAANLLHNPSSPVPLNTRTQKAMDAYLKAGGSLTDYEKQALSDYSVAGVTMEFMGGHKAKFIDNEDPAESDYWISLGYGSLKEALK